MSRIKRKTGSGFGSGGLSGQETEDQNHRGARSRYGEEMPDRAQRPSPMSMPVIDVRELSDEMLIFLLQLMAPEKYGRPATPGSEAESHQRPNPLRGYNLVQKPAQSSAVNAFSRCAQPAVVETLESVVSGESSVISYQSSRKRAGGVRSETPGSKAPPGMKSECGMVNGED